jgi:pimeloyl-ACP methyl ester carboxylesterase
LVGHSRGGNSVLRAAGRLTTRKMLFVAATFEFSTIARPTPEADADMPLRNSQRFLGGIHYMSTDPDTVPDLTIYNPQRAKEVFYNGCPQGRKDWAASRLRRQRRSETDPPLDIIPDLPRDYIVCTKDRAVNPDWQEYVARNWLGVEPIPFDSGHSPMISQPQRLAEELIRLAEN